METTSNVIDKNWKALIKPNKLDITSNDDKTIAKVVAEPLEDRNAYHLQVSFYVVGIQTPVVVETFLQRLR